MPEGASCDSPRHSASRPRKSINSSTSWPRRSASSKSRSLADGSRGIEEQRGGVIRSDLRLRGPFAASCPPLAPCPLPAVPRFRETHQRPPTTVSLVHRQSHDEYR